MCPSLPSDYYESFHFIHFCCCFAFFLFLGASPCLSMSLPLDLNPLTKDRLKLFKYLLWDLYMCWNILIYNGHMILYVYIDRQRISIYLDWSPFVYRGVSTTRNCRGWQCWRKVQESSGMCSEDEFFQEKGKEYFKRTHPIDLQLLWGDWTGTPR